MARYQFGDLMIKKRKTGPRVWQFRWTENGRRVSRVIGTVERLPRRADAERAVEYLRMRINRELPREALPLWTVGGLFGRFMEEYAARRCRKQTRRCYQSFFDNHIAPRWGDVPVEKVKTMDVEAWLDELEASRQIVSHVRSLMHNLFNAAIRWEMIERNPVDLIRTSRKRLKEPRVLAPPELKALLAELGEPQKTMVLVAVCLGLGVSELLALQWRDIDFRLQTLTISRSTVEGTVNATKTVARQAALPLVDDLAEVLLQHRSCADFRADSDFVFANATGGVRWADSLRADYLIPAGERAGIGRVGWHTFRRTYSTWLHALGATPAVQKELMRHADIQTTMNVYTQAPVEDKRSAAEKVAKVVWTMRKEVMPNDVPERTCEEP